MTVIPVYITVDNGSKEAHWTPSIKGEYTNARKSVTCLTASSQDKFKRTNRWRILQLQLHRRLYSCPWDHFFHSCRRNSRGRLVQCRQHHGSASNCSTDASYDLRLHIFFEVSREWRTYDKRMGVDGECLEPVHFRLFGIRYGATYNQFNVYLHAAYIFNLYIYHSPKH